MSKKNDEMMTGVKVQKSRTDKIFDFFLYTISTIIVIVMLYPMYFIVIASFSNPADVSAGNIVLLPKGITFKGYQKLLEYSQLWVGYKNTILYAALGTVISLVVNVPTAYALSRKDLCGRKLFTVFYLIPMFFTGGLIPTYLIVKDFGLLDNFWVMVLPFSVITYYIIVARTFFNNSIPGDLWEAAQIDGANSWSIFWRVTMPDLYPVIFYNIVTAVIGGMQIYAEPELFFGSGAGVDLMTAGYVSLIWFRGIREGNASLGAAYGMVLAVIILILTLFQFWLDSRNKD